jgi:hypothetical protein
MDLSRDGAVSRFSEPGSTGPEFLPVWNPDSRELLFSRGDETRITLLRQRLDGGPVKTVLDTDGPKFPADWSSDGRFLAFNSQWPEYRDMHLWTMQIDDAKGPRPLSQHPYSELAASFSPAEKGKAPRWIAYTSEDTGRIRSHDSFPSAVFDGRPSTWCIDAIGEMSRAFYFTSREPSSLGGSRPPLETGTPAVTWTSASFRVDARESYAASADAAVSANPNRERPGSALTVAVGWWAS